MAGLRTFFGVIGDITAAGGLVAVLVGLPLAVQLNAPPQSEASPMSRPRDAVIVSASTRLTQLVAFSIDSGILHGIERQLATSDRTIPRLQIDNAAFTLDFAPSRSRHEDSPIAIPELGPFLSQLAELKVASLVMRRASLTIERANGDRLRLTDITAEITAKGPASFAAQGRAQLNGMAVDFEASWSRPTDAKAPPVFPIRFKLAGNIINATFNGRLSFTDGPRLEGRTEIQARKLRAVASWLGLPIRMGRDLRDASIVGDLSWFNGRLAFPKATVTVDGNEGSGVLTLTTGGARPTLDGTLAFKTFSLTSYITTLLSEVTPHRAHQPGAQSILSLFDADLRLSAAKVVAPGFETGRSAVTLSLKGGRMLADLAELEIEGGTVGGQITVDVTGDQPRLGLKLRASEIDPGRAFADGLKRNPFLGRANMTLDAAGSGGTVPEILQALSGRGTFSLVQSGRLGLDLKALIYLVQRSDVVGWASAGKGSTALESLHVRFQVGGGGVVFETINAVSNFASFLGAGRADIVNRQLDLNLAFGSGLASEVPLNAREILTLRGPWSNPTFGSVRTPAVITAPAVKGSLLKGGMGRDIPAAMPTAFDPH